MATEAFSPRFLDLDSWSTAEMLAAMHEGQLAAAAAVGAALPELAAAVDDAAPALGRGDDPARRPEPDRALRRP